MNNLLITLFNNPQLIKSLSLENWSKVLTHGRDQNMLGRLWWRIKSSELESYVPPIVFKHFESSDIYVAQQEINIFRELEEIEACFKKRNIKVAVLKGAAYIAIKSDCMHGRTFSDIDLLVSQSQLREAEIALMTLGWFHHKETDYDKRYFREWMHEIQPMVHRSRLTIIDLHHNILPLTNKRHFNAELLRFENVNSSHLVTLKCSDRFIHSATHLFTEGEFPHAIRDITDLTILFNEVESDNRLGLLKRRSHELGLTDYTNYALYFVCRNLNLKPEAEAVKKEIQTSIISKVVTLPAYQTVFNFDSLSNQGFKVEFQLFWLYMRSHLIKMPLRILIPHLIKKFIFNMKKKFEEAQSGQPK